MCSSNCDAGGGGCRCWADGAAGGSSIFSVEGITVAAAAMAVQSSYGTKYQAVEDSPISTLAGPNEGLETPSSEGNCLPTSVRNSKTSSCEDVSASRCDMASEVLNTPDSGFSLRVNSVLEGWLADCSRRRGRTLAGESLKAEKRDFRSFYSSDSPPASPQKRIAVLEECVSPPPLTTPTSNGSSGKSKSRTPSSKFRELWSGRPSARPVFNPPGLTLEEGQASSDSGDGLGGWKLARRDSLSAFDSAEGESDGVLVSSSEVEGREAAGVSSPSETLEVVGWRLGAMERRRGRGGGVRPVRGALSIQTQGLQHRLPPLPSSGSGRFPAYQGAEMWRGVQEDRKRLSRSPSRDNEEATLASLPRIGETTPGSPCTPAASPQQRKLVCPDAPMLRSRELQRQGSLQDTKLLLTTKLKRSQSLFTFDKTFEFLREIGGGSFSTVYEARDVRGGQLVAVKRSKRQFRGREDRDRYLREIKSVADLSEHPNVVKYFCSWQQEGHFYIQMELCEGGSLRSHLDRQVAPLHEGQIWDFVQQIAAGLEHIHAGGVFHLDIKPANILLDGQGLLKIADFGSAVLKKGTDDWEEGDGGYVAPELLQDRVPGPYSDMYSFGAMAFEWATGALLPRSGITPEGKALCSAQRSAPLVDLLMSLLHKDPLARPTASDVYKWPH